ncbi:MAG: hypothetical protein ABI607_02010 [Betaproteobacteria bacterium]
MRTLHRMRVFTLAIMFAVPLFALAQDQPQVLGFAPSFTDRPLTAVPNGAAMRTRIWAPRLDDGWVSQGVAVGDGALWIAAYQSTDPRQDTGPCRVFKVDPRDGGLAGQFDLPAACGHAGGIAHTGDRFLYVVDSHHLFRIDTRAALAAGRCVDLACSTLPLRGSLRGAFLGYANHALWLGEWIGAGKGEGHLWRIAEDKVLAIISGSGGVLDDKAADKVLAIAAQSQGAAIAPDGTLWLTQSSSTFGRLQQIDKDSGRVMQQFALPAGVEDIEFAPDGTLWAVSEAGSRRWSAWSTFFPLVFSLDVGAVR